MASPTSFGHLRETFDRHEIRSEVRSDGFGSWVIQRRHEDGGWTSTFWARITAANGLLSVVGDFDPVVFAHYSPSNCPETGVAWMGGQRFLSGYVCEKAAIGTGGHVTTDLCPDKAREDFAALAAEQDQHAAECEEEGELLEAERHRKRASALRAEGLKWVEDYTGMPYSAATLIGLIEAVEAEAAAEKVSFERGEDFRGVGERPALRVALGHLAVRRLHVLLSERKTSELCPFRTYLRHLLALAPLPDEAGEADDIRDEMDAPWYAMSESDRELAAQVSEALQRAAPARESAQCILPEMGEQQYSMESPCCGAKVFLRDENFFADEAERCPDCGDLVIVTVSDDYADDARVDVIVEGCPLDNWPRPYGAAACADKGEKPCDK